MSKKNRDIPNNSSFHSSRKPKSSKPPKHSKPPKSPKPNPIPIREPSETPDVPTITSPTCKAPSPTARKSGKGSDFKNDSTTRETRIYRFIRSSNTSMVRKHACVRGRNAIKAQLICPKCGRILKINYRIAEKWNRYTTIPLVCPECGVAYKIVKK